MCWNPKYVLLLATSTIVTYISGLLIEVANNIQDEKKSIRLKKLYVFTSFAINISILSVFKYFNFFSENMNVLFSSINLPINIPQFDIIFPVGISFYTFQALSYTMDVFRKDVKAEKNLGKYALFVSFFPQLISGPIEKSKNFLSQIEEKHYFDYYRVKNGILLMIWGFFQKIVVADRLGMLVNTVFNSPKSYKGFQIIIAAVFYAFQIYCDFGAYSDIARGAAKVMGFRLTKNFESPYFSKSIREFWRRWHISLCSWFKDYLYIPLGGNRHGKLRKHFNTMVVFLVSGLWHGANITFIIWGGLHGAYQIIGDILSPVKRKLIQRFNIRTNEFNYRLLQVITTFILVDFAWIFFRANTYGDAITLIKNMFYFNPWIFIDNSIYNLGLDTKEFFIAVISIIVVLVMNLLQGQKDFALRFSKQNMIYRWLIYVTAIIAILIFGIFAGYDPQQFIYFQF
jgi:D-alanyl-lipoteichoic acid acyltransferase DltB (MBOAT superfamily)